MENRSVRTWIVIAVLALMVTSFVGGMGMRNASIYGLAAHLAQLMPGLYNNEVDSDLPSATDLRPLATFWEVREKVLRNFVFPLDDPKKLTYGAIRGMLNSLDDPYSRFLTPEEYSEFTKETEGSFEGIGVWLEQEKADGDKPARVVIMSIIPEGPAAKVDMRPGDQIMAVDGKAAADQTLQAIVTLMKGPSGSPVKLILKREGRKDLFEVTVTRARIEAPNVETKILPGDIGYLWLRAFNKQAEREARAGLEKLLAQNVKGIVFDLSMNGGGLLEQAISVTSLFLRDGNVVYVKERGGTPQPYAVLPGAVVPANMPLVVLVDQGSASASEITSGALQDSGRAKVIGTRTFGKSKVQTVIKLNDDSALILTTAVYLTPKMRDIGAPWPEDKTKKGLHPDISLPPPDLNSGIKYEDWHQGEVDKAAEYVRGLIAKPQG
ncbi:MAG TPA: S41 family peptidase [Armatimonadota bacterium]|jgi:carboxyl-terminal processing protease